MTLGHTILEGDLLSLLPTLPDNHFDAVLCDPPYHLTQNSRGGSRRKTCSPQPGDGGSTPFGRHRIGTDTGFMGQTWDGGDVAFRPETWIEVMRVMKPGAYLMAFGGSRTFHRLAVALEDAGFILVDTLMWLFGSGFPKSRNVSADIDKIMGGTGQRTGPARCSTYDGARRDPSRHGNPADQSHTGKRGLNSTPHGLPTVSLETPEGRRWDGYGSALKPAYEPVLLCRKPGEKTYAENAMRWGCGALNIDMCRIPGEPHHNYGRTSSSNAWVGKSDIPINTPDAGRWPANVLLDETAAEMLDAQTGMRKSGAHRVGARRIAGDTNVYGKASGVVSKTNIAASEGGASRFFYVSKVSTKERQSGVLNTISSQYKQRTTLREIEKSLKLGNDHPTLKPIDLVRQLALLLLPPKPDVGDRKLLVPFSGAGSEMIGALLAGWDQVTGIEQSAEYAEIARKRIAFWRAESLKDPLQDAVPVTGMAAAG